MPFLFEKKHIRREDDKRVKLSDSDRRLIISLYAQGDISMRQLARDFHVDKGTISFIVNPDKLLACKQRRAERGGSMQYYDKEKHRKYMKKYREHKRDLNNQGRLLEKDNK